jgi:hypothetical protein
MQEILESAELAIHYYVFSFWVMLVLFVYSEISVMKVGTLFSNKYIYILLIWLAVFKKLYENFENIFCNTNWLSDLNLQYKLEILAGSGICSFELYNLKRKSQ